MSTESTPNNARKPMGFGMTMLASATGFIVAIMATQLLSVIFFIGMLASFIGGGDSDATPLTGSGYAVELDFTGEMSECPAGELQALFTRGNALSIEESLDALASAATDDKVNAILLRMGGGTLGWAQAEELMMALLDFEELSGKPVIAYGEAMSQPEYYLATAANTIAMHPAGMMDFRGIGAEVMFYKGLMDKLGVSVDLIRPTSNAFKSAGEPYIRKDMSDANREQLRAYVSDIWNHVTARIAENRNNMLCLTRNEPLPVEQRLSVAKLQTIADNLSACLPDEAVGAMLIDTLCFEQDIKNILKEQYGVKHIVKATRYASSVSHTGKHDIAVIYAEGDVVDGKSQGTSTGVYSDDMVKALTDAAKDDDIKAIVLRINSPGGSAIASESMTHAVMEAKRHKPVVVSMSGVAASAGYELACQADCIVAHPTTLTGSIGVFSIIPEVSTLLSKHLGITTDTLQTARNSAGIGMGHPMTATSRAMLQRDVESFYKTFCQRVADGRKMPVEEVEKIARGRVWTGAQAKAIGLVDTLGGLDLAYCIAAEKAGVDVAECRFVRYPDGKGIWDQLMDLYNDSDDEVQLKARLTALFPYYSDLVYWSKMAPLQARLPFIIELK